MSVERVYPLFVLPRLPRRAAVLGAPEWRDGLERSGIEVVEPEGELDLVVAAAAKAEDALALAPRSLVLEGRLRVGALRRAGYRVRKLLPLPTLESPEVLLPLGDPAAVRYALGRQVSLGRPLRNRVASYLLGHGGLVPPGQMPTVLATRDEGPPAFVAAAARLLPVPEVRCLPVLARWGDPEARGVFLLFAPGADEPGWALKFARVPGEHPTFELDERGLRLAQEAGGSVAAHAPRLLGRLELDGHPASIETAATGRRLLGVLGGPEPRRERLTELEGIAAWIEAVARETRGVPGMLAEERRRLVEQVLPHFGIGSQLAESLTVVPSVFEHADLWPDNVLIGDHGGFGVLDWESARAVGVPLWDLFYFLTSSLPVLDGVRSGAETEEHFVRLWRGELPSSEIAFAWIRRLAAASGVQPEAVGSLATLQLLSLARADTGHAERLGTTDTVASAQLAALWLADPALGPGWDRWRG